MGSYMFTWYFRAGLRKITGQNFKPEKKIDEMDWESICEKEWIGDGGDTCWLYPWVLSKYQDMKPKDIAVLVPQLYGVSMYYGGNTIKIGFDAPRDLVEAILPDYAEYALRVLFPALDTLELVKKIPIEFDFLVPYLGVTHLANVTNAGIPFHLYERLSKITFKDGNYFNVAMLYHVYQLAGHKRCHNNNTKCKVDEEFARLSRGILGDDPETSRVPVGKILRLSPGWAVAFAGGISLLNSSIFNPLSVLGLIGIQEVWEIKMDLKVGSREKDPNFYVAAVAQAFDLDEYQEELSSLSNEARRFVFDNYHAGAPVSDRRKPKPIINQYFPEKLGNFWTWEKAPGTKLNSDEVPVPKRGMDGGGVDGEGLENSHVSALQRAVCPVERCRKKLDFMREGSGLGYLFPTMLLDYKIVRRLAPDTIYDDPDMVRLPVAQARPGHLAYFNWDSESTQDEIYRAHFETVCEKLLGDDPLVIWESGTASDEYGAHFGGRL